MTRLPMGNTCLRHLGEPRIGVRGRRRGPDSAPRLDSGVRRNDGSRWTLAFLPVSAALLAPYAVEACTVCFGDPESPMVKGATWGIWFLLGVVVSVEAAIGIFFFGYLRRRSKIYKDGSLKPSLRLVKE